MSGVPFMNRRTGLAAISSSILDFSSGSAMGGIVGRRPSRLELGDENSGKAEEAGHHPDHDRDEPVDHRVLEAVDPIAQTIEPVADLRNTTVQVIKTGIGPGGSQPHVLQRREKKRACGAHKCNFLSAGVRRERVQPGTLVLTDSAWIVPSSKRSLTAALTRRC